MGRKMRYKYGVQEIAEASGLKDAKVVKDINSGKLKYEDLRAVAVYIISACNPYVGELLKANEEEPF